MCLCGAFSFFLAAGALAVESGVPAKQYVLKTLPGDQGHVTELVLLGKVDEARGLLPGVIERLGADAAGAFGADYFMYLMGLLGQGKLEEAERLSSKTAARYPDAPLVRAGRLLVLIATGNDKAAYDEAGFFFDLYNNVLFGKPDADPVALASVAWAIYRENPDSAKRAFRILEEVTRRGSLDFVLARYWLAEISIERYHWEYAAKTLDDLIAAVPHHTYARLKRAELNIERDRYEEAAADVDEVLAIAPAVAEAHALRAEIAYTEEDMAGASAAMKAALALNPLSMRALAVKAAVAVEKGEGYADAEKAADAYGARKALFYHYLSRLLARRRRFELAVDAARKCVQQDLSCWQGYYEAGVNLLRLGEEQKGYEVLKKSFNLNPFNIWAFNFLRVLERQKEPSGKLIDIPEKSFVLRLPEAEAPILGYMLVDLYSEIIPQYQAKYKTAVRGPEETGGRLLVEILVDHNDFSVRSVGLPNLGALGVCFGRLVTMPSPRDLKARHDEVNWRIVLKHETSHAFTLQLTDYRIPRWLTEGMAMHDQGLPEYQWDLMLAYAHHNEEPLSLTRLNRYFGRSAGRRDVELAYAVSYFAVGWIKREWGDDALVRLALAYKKYGLAAHSQAVHEALNIELGNFENRLSIELADYVARNVPFLPPVSEEALASAVAVLEKNPVDKDALMTLIRGLMASGQVAKADEMLKRALSIYTRDPSLIAMKAQRLLDEENFKAARELLEPTVKDLASARFWNTFLAGIAAAGLADHEGAARFLSAAETKCPHYISEDNPGRASLRVLLARSLLELRRAKDAREMLLKELASSSTALKAARMLVDLALKAGDNATRLIALDRIIDVDPFDAGARLARAEALMEARRPEKAFLDARAAATLEEENVKALEAMVQAAAALGGTISADTARLALEASRRLAAIDPGNKVLAARARDIALLKERADGR